MAVIAQKVTPSAAYKQMSVALRAGLAPFMRSSPGIGKSSLVKKFAKANNLFLIDIRLSTCSPEDLNGLPHFDENGNAVFKPFDFWPLAHKYKKDGSDFPINEDTGKPYSGFFIFCDEFNQAPKSVQAAAYRLILDREIGQHPLHKLCVVAAAGNLMTDRAIATDIGTALQSRFVHLHLEASYEDWLTAVALPNKYDPRLIAYLAQFPTKLMDFDPRHNDLTFCCPRTWEFTNAILKQTPGDLDEVLPLLCGTITSLVATELVQFAKVFKDVVPVSEILQHPDTARVPGEKAMQWATTTAMADHLTVQNFDKMAIYADRLPLTMRVMFYRSALARLPAIVSTPAFGNAMSIMAKYLNG